MCSRQICRNCVMLSCKFGPKSLRNVFNTFLNLCHKELRQFSRQKGVQPGTSKVCLIKCPVSVYRLMVCVITSPRDAIRRPLQNVTYKHVVILRDDAIYSFWCFIFYFLKASSAVNYLYVHTDDSGCVKRLTRT